MRFVAGPGEQNRLRVRFARREYVFHDAGSRLWARGQCRSVDRHTAICPSDIGPAILLGDGDDRAWLEGGTARGGSGDDRLTGRGHGVRLHGDAGNDVLRGGDGSDGLYGGPGRDRLFGGEGDDRLFNDETDAQAAPDLFDGGPEREDRRPGDEIRFARSQKPLRISLDRDIRATRDSFVDVENVIGGSGNDRLTGDDRSNVLAGGDGADVVRGGRGNDSLRGGPGNDRLYGGPHSDYVSGDKGSNQLYGGAGRDELDGTTLFEEDNAPDALDCGAAADLAVADPSDTLSPACEQYLVPGFLWYLRSVPKLRGDHAEFVLGCGGCAGTLALRSVLGEEYGRVDFDFARPTFPTAVSVPLSPSGVAALRDGTVVQIYLGWEQNQFPWGYRMFLHFG